VKLHQRRRILSLFAAVGTAVALSWAAPAASRAESSAATDVVGRFHEALLDVMKKSSELGYEGRYDTLSPVLDETFDSLFMAQKSVGREWKKMSPQEQRRLLDTIERYTIANYAGRFQGYAGEQFETMGEEESLHGTTLVRTKLIIPDEDDVHLDYRLRAKAGDWKIIDIYLDGTVSELALRRAQYSPLIKREGLDALIAAIDAKVGKLAAGKVSEL